MREEGPPLPIPTHLAPRPAQAFGIRRRRRGRVGGLAAQQRHWQCPSAGILQALDLVSVQRRVSRHSTLAIASASPSRAPGVSERHTVQPTNVFLRSSVLVQSVP
jgi:hypothetical protein